MEVAFDIAMAAALTTPLTDEDGGPKIPSLKEANDEIRRNFVRKVYGILAVQLVATTALAYPVATLSKEELKVAGPPISCLAFSCLIATLCSLQCCGEFLRVYPWNYWILSILTFANGLLVGLVCTAYTAPSIVLAVGITAATFFGLTIYAWTTKSDVTGFGMYLFAALLVLLVASFALSMMQLFGLEMPLFQKAIAVMGSMIFAFYIVFDTQMMLGSWGGHKMEFSIDDYAFAALNLYLDIINFFLYILEIVGTRE